MYSVITTATHREIVAALGTGLGNKPVPLNVSTSREEPGAIIVSVPESRGNELRMALQRLGAWFDRAMPPGRVPAGRPIVTHAGASSIRNPHKKLDGLVRKDRAIRRAMKGAGA